jgi:hypothetical protein
MRSMVRALRKFTAVTAALAVLVAHALCLCRTATAAAATHPNANAAHHCCKHDSPDKSPPSDGHPRHSDGHCRHCDGFAAPALKAGDGSLAHATLLDAVAADFGTRDGTGLQVSGLHRAAAHIPEFSSPPTLLRLCCALNL